MMEQYLQDLRKNALVRQVAKPEAVVGWLIDNIDVSLTPLAGLDTDRLISTVLRSNAFFSPSAYRQKTKSPLEYALNLSVALDAQLAPAQLHAQLAALGQRLPIRAAPDAGSTPSPLWGEATWPPVCSPKSTASRTAARCSTRCCKMMRLPPSSPASTNWRDAISCKL